MILVSLCISTLFNKGLTVRLPQYITRAPHSIVGNLFFLYESLMANIKSAKKRAKQTLERAKVNRSRLSDMRTYIKMVEKALHDKDSSAAEEALKLVEPKLMRYAQKRVLHKNTATRKLSRLSAQVNKLKS